HTPRTSTQTKSSSIFPLPPSGSMPNHRSNKSISTRDEAATTAAVYRTQPANIKTLKYFTGCPRFDSDDAPHVFSHSAASQSGAIGLRANSEPRPPADLSGPTTPFSAAIDPFVAAIPDRPASACVGIRGGERSTAHGPPDQPSAQ